MSRRPVTAIAVLLVGAFVDIGNRGDSDDPKASAVRTISSDSSLELISDATLTVACDLPSSPFEFGDPPDYEGFDIDLINAIAEDRGLEVKIVEVPLDEILDGAWAGRFDLSIASVSITDARKDRVAFSDPYFETQQSLLVKKDGPIQSIDDVTSDTVIGAEAGTTCETFAKENTEAEVHAFETPGDVNALVRGEVDAVFQDLLVTTQAVKDYENLAVVQTFPTGERYGIIFPLGSSLRGPINESLRRLKDDGTLAELYIKWFDQAPPQSLLTAGHEPS
jgi:ABC-type amino acid transport substrate-binding protein